MDDIEEQFIEKMWSALEDDSGFLPVIDAWDKLADLNQVPSEAHYKRIVTRLRKDLERLDTVFNIAVNPATQKQNADSQKDTVAIESSGKMILNFDVSKTYKLSAKRFNATLAEMDVEQRNPSLLKVKSKDYSDDKIFVAIPLSSSNEWPKIFELKCLQLDWKESYSKIIANLFPLTRTEIAILIDIFNGRSANEIAESRSRSVLTVRTQIKSLMVKMGVKTQRELVAIVGSVVEYYKTVDLDDELDYQVFHAASGSIVSYYDYGDRQGKAVLLISTIYPAKPSQYHRQFACDHGLRMIAPNKPGSGASSMCDGDEPFDIVKDYIELIKSLDINSIIVAGHASGGLYAFIAAKLLGENCSALVTIDTGAPFSSVMSIFRMPAVARRTFLAARFSPKILLAPHKLAAKDFYSSEKGERRVIDYFFSGHPFESSQVQNDAYYYQATHQLIDYSFDNIDRLVGDIARWSRDWSKQADDLPATLPRYAVIGDKNLLFDQATVRNWCLSKGWHFVLLEDEGQLLIGSKQDKLFSFLAQLRNQSLQLSV